MITRHFYKEDEVRSALMWCCAFGRVREALFWTQELIDSNNGEDALRILVHAWILFYGIGNIRWIKEAYRIWSSEGFGEDDLILLAFQLSSLPNTCHDSSVLTLLYLGTQELKTPPDRVTQKGCALDSDKSMFHQTILRAIAQGKTEFLWYLLRSEWNENLWTFLLDSVDLPEKKEYLQIIQKMDTLMGDELKVWFFRALAIAIATRSNHSFQKSCKELPIELKQNFQKDRKLWEEQLGRKNRREYPIPKDCLYWVTERGNISYYDSTLDEIPDLLQYLKANEYWNDALGNQEFDDLSEEEKVDFLDLYMPDGHPMTWDPKELEKSHGPGVLRNDESPNHVKWLRIWMRSTESCLIWKGWERAMEIANKFPDLDLNSFYSENQKLWKESMVNWNLKPVKKILIVKTNTEHETYSFIKNPEPIKNESNSDSD